MKRRQKNHAVSNGPLLSSSGNSSNYDADKQIVPVNICMELLLSSKVRDYVSDNTNGERNISRYIKTLIVRDLEHKGLLSVNEINKISV